MRARIYQVNINEKYKKKSFLVKAGSMKEAIEILNLNMHAYGVILLGEITTRKEERAEEVFPVCFEEDVMSEESKYYRK